MTLREEEIRRGFAADYIRYLLSFLESKGLERTEILKLANIQESDLDKGGDWIYHSLDYQKISEKLQSMGLGEVLGLEFGASISVKDHGYAGYAAGNARTLREAIELLARYFRTRTTLFSLSVFEEGDVHVLQIDNHAELGAGLNFWVQAIIGTLGTIVGEIFGDELIERLTEEGEVRVPFDLPGDLPEEVQDMLTGISFGHSVSQMRIPSHLMDTPLKNPDTFVSEMAQKHCDDQLMHVEPMQQGIISRVRQILEAEKGDYPNLEAVSGELNMSSRSLKRKLKAVDSSFQLILDSVRKAEAIEYLCHTDDTIDDISRQLGFSDPSNFGRAFKKWMGMSPRAYRNRAKENLAAPS